MRIEGLSTIAGDFDAMLIDQFGVIHDGQKLYPGALRALRELHVCGIPVVVITNSGKRAALNAERLIKMGLQQDQFAAAVSSGEVAYERVKGRRVFLIGRSGEDYGFAGVNFVQSFDDAELILVLGTNVPDTTMAEYETLLLQTRLPMLCCNPDKQMLTPQGLQPAPGAIADIYAKLGGSVTWIGKPHPEIYEAALNLLDNPKRVLCIGDSAEHDVVGGKAAGLKTLLVMTGVSQGLSGETASPRPDFYMQDFSW